MKHRILGSLILLSLAVIILPFWLDGAGLEEYRSAQKQQAMPAQSELVVIESLGANNSVTDVDVSDATIIELSPIKVVQEAASDEEKPAVKIAKAETSNKLLNPQGLPNGWAVQLGSFGNKSNAVRLKDKVIKAGFAAYMVPNAAQFKVLVGPELNRAKAEILQKKLNKKFKMPGMVVLYKVEKP